jgi:hypothetical protein
LASDDGSKKYSTDIAQQLDVDPLLVGRLMRHLAAMGYIKEIGPDQYIPTNFSNAITIPLISDGYPLI